MNSYCTLCPNNCNANRESVCGACGEKNTARIAKYYLHPYEEPVISGTNGSGTVFFSGCSLKCVFCQNYDLSRSVRGKEVSSNELADIFKQLEQSGAHNINLVNPTHFLPQIREAFKIYRPNIPVVYNTHGYEKIQSLEIANTFTDIYLPDLKYFSPDVSARYTGKRDYFKVAAPAIKYMMQSKRTVIADGLMQSGVCVRHLILPLNVSNSIAVINWFASNRENGAYFSLMAQYTPYGKIENFPELQRKITAREYNRVLSKLSEYDIEECFIQKRSSAKEVFIPDWDY